MTSPDKKKAAPVAAGTANRRKEEMSTTDTTGRRPETVLERVCGLATVTPNLVRKVMAAVVAVAEDEGLTTSGSFDRANGPENGFKVEGVVDGDIDDAGVAVIEFLADPGDGVFTHRPSGHGDLLRLTKTDCLDIPVGVGETNGRHGRAVEVRQCQLKLERIRCGGEVDGDAVAPDSERVPHDDSSTGTHPAATGGTDSVEGSSRRGDDSRPGGDGEVRS